MKIKVFIIFLFAGFLACKTDKGVDVGNEKKKLENEIVFDQAKWKTKDGADYPYRDKMLKEVIYSDSIRSLNKDEIFELLGDPDLINDNYLYYTVAQTRLGLWPLKTKTLVIKFFEDDNIDWMKIHE